MPSGSCRTTAKTRMSYRKTADCAAALREQRDLRQRTSPTRPGRTESRDVAASCARRTPAHGSGDHRLPVLANRKRRGKAEQAERQGSRYRRAAECTAATRRGAPPQYAEEQCNRRTSPDVSAVTRRMRISSRNRRFRQCRNETRRNRAGRAVPRGSFWQLRRYLLFASDIAEARRRSSYADTEIGDHPAGLRCSVQ